MTAYAAAADQAGTDGQFWKTVAGVPVWSGIDQSNVAGLAAALAALAPTASPTFIGDPKGPTPPTSDNDTSFATTAFVRAAIAAYAPRLPASANTLYVDSTNGNDSNDGLSPASAKASIITAYAALTVGSATNQDVRGGRIICLPGNYDLYNGGNGLQIDAFTPLELMSLTGYRHWGQTNQGGAGNAGLDTGDVRLYSSGSIADLVKILPSTSVSINNNYGGGFYGLKFYLGSTVTAFGIHGVNANRVTVANCYAEGKDATTGVWFLGSEVDTAHGDDASWWRILNNVTYQLPLHKAGNFSGGIQNCNNHVWAYNVVGLGAKNDAGISIMGGTRCVSMANNFEGTGASSEAIRAEQTRVSAFVFDAGEKVKTFYHLVGTTNNNGNILMPMGITTMTASQVLITDDNAKRNYLFAPARYSTYQSNTGEGQAVKTVTANTTLTTDTEVCRVDATAGNVVITIPSAVNWHWARLTIRRVDSSGNTVTIQTAGGNIEGASTYTGLTAQGKFVTFRSDETNFFIEAAN